MRNVLLFGMLSFFICAHSQNRVNFTESFDGTVGFTVNPSNSWTSDATLYATSPYSYHGNVPIIMGDTIELVSPYYNLTNYQYVKMKFSHICKVSISDICQIQYQENQIGAQWETIPTSSYKGHGIYIGGVFNHASYSEWNMNDSLTIPNNSWWKQEEFDISGEVAYSPQVRFRFVIKRGNVANTNFAYGWVVDNFELIASIAPILSPTVSFEPPLLKDTVYSTGPFEINAKLVSRSGYPMLPPKLVYTKNYNSIITKDSILMTSVQGDTIWTATIPNQYYGTHISYSINAYDSVGNSSSVNNAFYTSRINHNTQDTIIIGTSRNVITFIQYQVVTPILGENSYSCMLYNVADYTKYGGIIKSIAWEQAPYTSGPYTYKNQKIYMYAVKASEPPSVYQDAYAKGWQLVYDDSIVFTQSGGWINMTLSSPFYLPPGYNLYIQNENRNAVAPPAVIPFYYTSTPNTFRGGSSSQSFPNYGGTISEYRTNLRLVIDPINYDSNSVMLYTVKQPSVESVINRDSTVIVQIKNMGIKNLDSTTINWSINGIIQTPYIWKHTSTGIPEGFLSDTIHIGYYNPIEEIDTLRFWVSLPNGQIDSVIADDTLRYTLNACTGMLSGEYVIGGDTGDFPTITAAINTLYFCGMSGNVTFKISSGEYPIQGYNVLLEFMEPITGMGINDTLFVTSASGRAQDVIICPFTLGCGVYLKDVQNIVFSHLTFSTKNQIYNNRAVDITTGCSNIEFSHCIFDITRLTPGQTDGSAFWIPTSSAPVNGLRINHNTFLGAYNCIYIGSNNTNRTNNVEIVGNQMLNCHCAGVYNGGSYVDFKRVSDNYITFNPNTTATTLSGIRIAAGTADEVSNNTIIIPRVAASSRTAYGIYFTTSVNRIKDISNNKIKITEATTSYGIYLSYMNLSADTNQTIVANNEIISDCSGTNYGIYASSNYNTHLYHNSIYLSGAGATSRPFYEGTAASTGSLKNNILVTLGGDATGTANQAVYLISTSSNNWDISYNNYYTVGTVLGYGASANRADLAAWKAAIPKDSNSISALPPFSNLNKNLVLNSYVGFECPLLPDVTSELRGFPRDTLNYMGCYTDIQLSYNLALTSFISPASNVLINGVTTPLTVVMKNKGDTTITNVEIAWKHNDVLKKTISWTGSLAKSDTTIIYLDTLISVAGENNIQVYSYLPNGKDDEYTDNDTIANVFYGCDSALNGVYSVGNATSDFATLEDAINLLKNCGISGPVTLELVPGVYNPFVFSQFDIQGSNDSTMITITAAARNINSVYIWFTTGSNGITLDNVKHLKLEYLNLDGTSSSSGTTNGILFASACENVEINRCYVRMNTSTTTSTIRCLTKNNATGILNNVRIINNIFSGAYYGVYLYAGISTGTNQYGTNIVIDSNIIRDQYYYATYLYYADFKSVSYNTILSRTASTTTTWYGLRFAYCNYYANANKVYQLTNAITSPYLIYNYYVAYYNATNRSLLSNNELIGYSTGTYYGIYNSYAAVDVFHNSVYIKGTGATRGIYTSGSASYVTNCKNNNVVMLSSRAHPVYIGTTNTYTGDYNNYFAPAYVGYSGGNRTTIANWQTATNQDANSISVQPSFIDSSVNLKMTTTVGFECPALSEVPSSIDGFLRIGTTAIGCYGLPIKQFDAAMAAIECFVSPMITGESTPLNLVFMNAGFDTIKTLTIGWELNGIAQTPLTWAGSLELYEQDTISMGSIVPIPANNTIKVYFLSINGSLIDSNAVNDTLFYSAYACDSILNGTYTVGSTGSDIPTIEEMFTKLTNCGVSGPVTFEFVSGVYNEEIAFLSNFKGMSATNTITFTSAANHPDSVVFASSGIGSVFTIGEVSNFTIKNITIDATACYKGINITAGCENIEIRGCNILSDTTTNSSLYMPICKASATGIANNIRIIDNVIDGGYYGIQLYGGTGTAAYGTNMVIDSNIIKNQYYYGTYFYYADFKSVSYNTILSRTANTTTTWYGLCFNYCNYYANANKVYQLTNAITSPYLIYSNYAARYNTINRSLLSNNELIGYSTGVYYGIYASYSALDVFHNSVYIKGTGATRGIYTSGSASYVTNCKNNNVVMLSPTAHPVYIGTVNTYTGDYNNYYAPAFVGYSGGDQTSMANWQAVTSQDTHSVSINPNFIDAGNSLELLLYEGFKCPTLTNVPLDINDYPRTNNIKGAYARIIHDVDVALTDVREELFTSTSQQTPLYVILENYGSDTLYSTTVNWRLNGIIQTPIAWTGVLAFDEKDTVLLDSITPIFACNELQVWTTRPNDTIDKNTKNDTLYRNCIYVCDSALNGSYVVGASGKFSTINAAITALYNCGISGPVTIAIDSGSYYEYITFTENIPGSDSVNTITFTSTTANATDVVICNNGDGTVNRGTVQLKNTAHLVFTNITISGRAAIGINTYTYAKAVEFIENNENIEINNCILDLPTFVPVVTSNNYTGIFKASYGVISNIRILNNVIRGGAFGVSVYGASSTVRNTDVLFQGNTMYDIDYYGIQAYYTNFAGVKNNTIKQRTGSNITPPLFTAIYIYYSDAEVVANKIEAANMNNLIYLNYSNGLIANNQIIGYATGTYAGIYLGSNTTANIYHNSLYITGNGFGRGIYLTNNNLVFTDIKNNNICMMTNTDDYGVYLGGVNYLDTNWTFDYNNYYSLNGNIGYASGNQPTLANWQNVTKQDTHSTNIYPRYLNVNQSLILMDSILFSCPSIASVPRDINDSLRGTLTTKGAYHYAPFPYDAMLVSISSPTSTPKVGVTTPLTVIFQNAGTDTLYSVILNWSLNGVIGTTHTWGGVLPPKAMQTITLGNFVPTFGESELIVWTSLPAGYTDGVLANDTLHVSLFGCDSALKGTYTVGNPSMDFITYEDAYNVLIHCGVSGPTVFLLDSGNYNGMLFDKIIKGSSITNTITFRSASSNPNDVVFSSTTSPLMLENAAYLNFENITFDGRNVETTVSLDGNCSDIVIDSCMIYASASATASNYRCVSQNQSSAVLKNIRIANSYISGGYYGIYLYAQSAACNENIIINNNTLLHQYNVAIYSYYTEFESIGNNLMKPRATGTTNSWYGINAYYSSGKINGNQIYSDELSIVPYGIYVYYWNQTTGRGLIANNDIYLNSSGTNQYGLSALSSNADIIHNTIYLSGKPTNLQYAANIVTSSVSNTYQIKNNIFISIGGTTSYAIYLSTLANLPNYTLDYNNYYSSGNIGYVSNAIATLEQWKTTTSQDVNSINVYPPFIDTLVNLKTDSTFNNILSCPIVPQVMQDREGYTRSGFYSVMGAYGLPPVSIDASIPYVLRTSITPTTGQTYPLEVVIGNTGTDTIYSATISWTFNGTTQNYNWSGILLPLYGMDTILLDSIVFVSGDNSLSVWVSNPNNKTDLNTMNDTLSLTIYSCALVLNGAYIVGDSPNADFSLTEVATILHNCGVSGPVVLQMESGIYPELVLNEVYPGMSSTNTISLTSLNSDPDSVIFQSTSTALLLDGVSNFSFKYITFDASSGKYGVELKGTCSNIEFYGCKIKADPSSTEVASTTSSTIGSAGVYYANTSTSNKYLGNVRFIKNHIDGGSSNIFIAYMASVNTQMGSVASVTIDSNILTNAYSQGIHSYYNGYYPSISYNTITPRAVSTVSYYGISSYYYHTIPQMVANKINISGRNTSYGIYLYYYHNYSNSYGAQGSGLLANNEIIITNATSSSYGIYVYENSQWNIYHNSLYLASNASACYALYISNSLITNVLNNNIMVQTSSTASYALYKPSAAYATSSYGLVDYNNYYSQLSSNLAYIGRAITSIADMQLVSLQDISSVSVSPNFINVVNSLALASENGLTCPRFALVKNNIEGKVRKATTAMGAYSSSLYDGSDLVLTAFIEPSETSISCLPDFTPVKIALSNLGAKVIDFTSDSVVLHLNVSGMSNYQTSVTLNTGALQSENTNVVEFYSALDITLPGMYYFEAWITSDVDTLKGNDTIRLDYYVDKTVLPYDNDFTSAYIYTKQLYGSVGWEIIENNPSIASVYGTKSLYFNSALMSGRGSVSRAILRSVALQGTLQPTLEFWYAHDAINSNLLDYMMVKISTDGGETFTNLQTIYRYNSAYTTPAWEHYSIDLSNYTNGNCILIAFEAASYGGGDQSIDRIVIVSKQDISLALDIPDQSDFVACELDNQSIIASITNRTSQQFGFDQYPSQIHVVISGAVDSVFTIPLTSGSINGDTTLSYLISNAFDFTKNGTYNIMAYLDAADDNYLNDTVRETRIINVNAQLIAIDSIGMKSIGDQVYPTIHLTNIGNIPINDISAKIYINNILMITETIDSLINPGDTLIYTFTSPFTVPTATEQQPFYQLRILLDLPCDGVPANNSIVKYNNVHIPLTVDLNITAVNYPTADSCEIGFSKVYPSIEIENLGSMKAQGAVLYIMVDSAGVEIEKITENLPDVDVQETKTFVSTQAYTVPNMNGNYTVRFNIEMNGDIDTTNNKRSAVACAKEYVSVANINAIGWELGQNIPNPTANLAQIPYMIPQDGQISFKVMSINGQILYTSEMQVFSGSHILDFDATALSSGIYYYSMEYQGQRIVKKMTIQK